ncbi:hypothetical protein OM076_39260 [Solirubrobacter ginsenosidimutans]|uniref:Uncharacterized protein n=1 Tax=Solirubrobacter ginsenosidimutans TaxID=490573 RepID=A0A9X3N0T3_9ACTN|nr:hypothetical protein [Solirubrobacter ginsenosidimutans]MDA0166369.1 hypothetical protein [Solirubrobacter ginsenosidimutans]
MKRLLSFAAGMAAIAAPVVVIVSREASAVDGVPAKHYQMIEAEFMTPVLESYAGVASGTATTSVLKRMSNSGTTTFSGSAGMQLDNHNADGSPGTLPFEVEDTDTYGVGVRYVKGPTYGVVQFVIDGDPIGAPIDAYATAVTADEITLGALGLTEGKHQVSMVVTGKNDAATDYLAGFDYLELDSTAVPAATPTAVATAEVGAQVPATLALSVGAPASFAQLQPGVEKDYSATTTATVTSTAGDAALTVTDPSTTAPGKLVNGSFSLAEPLRVAGGPLPATVKTWSGPTSSEPVELAFTQHIGAREPLRTGNYGKTLTLTLSTTNP